MAISKLTQLASRYFFQGARLTDDDDESLKTVINNVISKQGEVIDVVDSERATVSTGDVHYYLDTDNGSDDNNGTSASTPFKTTDAISALVPDIIQVGHSFVVHVLNDPVDEQLYIRPAINNGNIVITGLADEWVVVDDNGGNDYTADGGGTTAHRVSGAGWTPNEFKGTILRCKTGANAGQIRPVLYNTDEFIYTNSDNNNSVVNGDTFDIVKPKTVWTNDNVYGAVYAGGYTGTGTVYFANMRIEGSKGYLSVPSSSSNKVYLQRLFVLPTITSGVWLGGPVNSALGLYALYFTRDFSEGEGFFTTTHEKNNAVVFGADTDLSMDNVRSGFTMYNTNFLAKQTFENCVMDRVWGCGFLGGLHFINCNTRGVGTLCFGIGSGYQRCRITNDSGSGIVVEDCPSLELTGVNCVDCQGHGVEVINSRLISVSDYAQYWIGSGNTGLGMYVHLGGKVTIEGTTAPTLTGDLGDVSTDPTGPPPGVDWSSIIGGTALVDTTELSGIWKI